MSILNRISKLSYLSSMLAIAEDIIFSLPAGEFFCVVFWILAPKVQLDVVSKYTFLKQRIKPTWLTVEERELEGAASTGGRPSRRGCPQEP